MEVTGETVVRRLPGKDSGKVGEVAEDAVCDELVQPSRR